MLRLAKILFFLLIFSLPFMKLDVAVGGLAANATDVLFLVAAACLAAAVLKGEPGPYPRLESTFAYPAMLTNFLTVSLLILLIARRLGWIGSPVFYLLLVPILVTSVFSLTPGLGGIFLAIGLWLYASERIRAPRLAFAALAGGAMAALLFVLAATVTPIIHPTAPFLIHVPGLGQELAPSVRLMTWIDAIARFTEHPLLGAGIGSDAVAVRYADPSGNLHRLTDAHNVFLNVAVQCGLVGVAAIIWLIVRVANSTGKLRLNRDNVVRLGIGLAWLNAFVYQGLTGSYEDARHLWVLLGLLLVSIRLEQAEAHSPAAPGAGGAGAGRRAALSPSS